MSTPWSSSALVLLALGALGGCDADKINESEAEEIFGAQVTVVGDVYREAYDAVEAEGSDAALEVDASGDTVGISGTVESGSAWNGSVDVDGSASVDRDAGEYTFDLDLVYNSVKVRGVTLDGDTSVGADAILDLNNGIVDIGFDTKGDFQVSGEAKGHATFRFSLIVDVDVNAGSYGFAAEGQVSGFDVSSMSLSDLTGWITALYE